MARVPFGTAVLQETNVGPFSAGMGHPLGTITSLWLSAPRKGSKTSRRRVCAGAREAYFPV